MHVNFDYWRAFELEGDKYMKNLEHQNQVTVTTYTQYKAILIDQLRKRGNLAYDKGFFLETILAYGLLLEERIFSVNSKLDPTYPHDKIDCKFTLGKLIIDFKPLRQADAVLRGQVNDGLLNDLEWFRDFRNNITHVLLSDDLVKSNNDLKDLAKFARDTSEEFRLAVRRWKNKVM